MPIISRRLQIVRVLMKLKDNGVDAPVKLVIIFIMYIMYICPFKKKIHYFYFYYYYFILKKLTF